MASRRAKLGIFLAAASAAIMFAASESVRGEAACGTRDPCRVTVGEARNAHNGYRARHCVRALGWDVRLAQEAQKSADACSFSHSTHRTNQGENSAWGPGLTASGAAALWYGEVNKYDFRAPVYSKEVGQFTQLVWKESQKIGCAKAVCGGQNYWVCRYSPAGNMNVVPNQHITVAQAQDNLKQSVPKACK